VTREADPGLLDSVMTATQERVDPSGGVDGSTRVGLRPGPSWLRGLTFTAVPLALVLGLASFLRFWQLDRIGFNSDEAVYTGTAASLAGNHDLQPMFPIFRAHPLFLQIILSFFVRGEVSDWKARAVTAIIGVLTVGATYLLGRRLYGNRAGLFAALFLAVMPYHVIVSRQVLLDGLMTLCAVGVLYCVVRYAESAALRWMLAAGAAMGATVLAKETSIVLLGGLYAFFALTPAVRIRIRHVVLSLAVTVLIVVPFPLAVTLSGRTSTGQHFLLWQLFRRPNHDVDFYLRTVPSALGWLVLAVAAIGLLWLRRERTWRERLLLTWIVVPVVFFTLWPVKGYQYLLPLAPVAAILAGRTVARIGSIERPGRRIAESASLLIAAAVTVSMVVPTWNRIDPSPDVTYLAGTGGLPGGREAGRWIAANLPVDAQLLAAGPSMANVLEIYGERRVFALSISPDPANRNPAYVPVANPDLAIRRGQFQYVVWDSYTASRSAAFGAHITKLITKFHGVAMYTSAVAVRTSSGGVVETPTIIIYRVRTTT
jgi:hypothetical protein